jgi:hypothetical protein
MERIIATWSAGIEGAKKLRNEQRFSEATAIFESMQLIWPGERHVRELRALVGHW